MIESRSDVTEPVLVTSCRPPGYLQALLRVSQRAIAMEAARHLSAAAAGYPGDGRSRTTHAGVCPVGRDSPAMRDYVDDSQSPSAGAFGGGFGQDRCVEGRTAVGDLDAEGRPAVAETVIATASLTACRTALATSSLTRSCASRSRASLIRCRAPLSDSERLPGRRRRFGPAGKLQSQQRGVVRHFAESNLHRGPRSRNIGVPDPASVARCDALAGRSDGAADARDP